MRYRSTNDKAAIESFLSQDPLLHIYELGDLDPFFWPQTTWYAAGADSIKSLALVYDGTHTPTLLAFERAPSGLTDLLPAASNELPDTMHAHVSPHLVPCLETCFEVHDHGCFLKMALPAPTQLPGSAHACEFFTVEDREELESFYAQAYPENWFDSRMLETGFYAGVREDGQVACVAGVHVYSEEYDIAALGNIATAPSARRRGLARASTAVLCEALRQKVTRIGLNVSANNESAVGCYQGLGFEPIAEYQELTLRRRAV